MSSCVKILLGVLIGYWLAKRDDEQVGKRIDDLTDQVKDIVS